MDEKHNLVLVSVVGIVAIVALSMSLVPRVNSEIPTTTNGVNPFVSTGQAGLSPYGDRDSYGGGGEVAEATAVGNVCEDDSDCTQDVICNQLGQACGIIGNGECNADGLCEYEYSLDGCFCSTHHCEQLAECDGQGGCGADQICTQDCNCEDSDFYEWKCGECGECVGEDPHDPTDPISCKVVNTGGNIWCDPNDHSKGYHCEFEGFRRDNGPDLDDQGDMIGG